MNKITRNFLIVGGIFASLFGLLITLTLTCCLGTRTMSNKELLDIKTILMREKGINKVEVLMNNNREYSQSLTSNDGNRYQSVSMSETTHSTSGEETITKNHVFENQNNITREYETSYLCDANSKCNKTSEIEISEIEESSSDFKARFAIDMTFLKDFVRNVTKGEFVRRETFIEENEVKLGEGSNSRFSKCNLYFKEPQTITLKLYEKEYVIDSIKKICVCKESIGFSHHMDNNGSFTGKINGENKTINFDMFD